MQPRAAWRRREHWPGFADVKPYSNLQFRHIKIPQSAGRACVACTSASPTRLAIGFSGSTSRRERDRFQNNRILI